MKKTTARMASAGVAVTLSALLATVATASAQEGFGPMARHAAVHHGRSINHMQPRAHAHLAHGEGRRHLASRHMAHVAAADSYRPLTVGRANTGYVPYGSGYNPYGGPGVVVTGPIAVGATLASLPFRLINAVFPYDAHDPRVVVGGPVHLAGRLVQAPFAIAQAPFGGPGPFVDPGY